MALKFKYKDEHGILQIHMSPTTSPKKKDIEDPKFDSINTRFGQYDLFGGKYDVESLDSSGESRSLFRSRYNSVEEELANTPYAFATPNLDITINQIPDSSSRESDIEDNRFFTRNLDYEFDADKSFTVTQLIHAQDRYFDLSSRIGSNVKVRSASDDAFKVLGAVHSVKPKIFPVVPTSKRKRESSFAILTETPIASRPSSPRSLPVYIRREKISPFRGRGFREETSRHNTPKSSTPNSRHNSPPRRRTHSLPRIDKMATATLPPPIQLITPSSPRNFLKENIEEVRELSEFNREKHEAEAEQKRIEEEEALLKEMGLLDKKSKSRAASRSTSRSNSPSKINLRSRSNSPSAILQFEVPAGSKIFINEENRNPVAHKSRLRSISRSQPQSNDSSPKHSKIPKRQSSVSPSRSRLGSKSKSNESLNRNQRFISNSTNSIHETIKIGSQVHDKRGMSKSTQHLEISPAHIIGKPPISPGRGPPPVNKTVSTKRLSPIVGTPNKSPTDDLPISKTAKPTSAVRKNGKTTVNTTATSRLNSIPASRDASPEKRKGTVANSLKTPKPTTKAASTKPKPTVPNKTDPKSPIKRTNSIKSLTRTPSTKNLNEKPPIIKKTNSRKDLTEKYTSFTKLSDAPKKDNNKEIKKPVRSREPSNLKKGKAKKDAEPKQEPNETTEAKKQEDDPEYDKISNLPSELVMMTKKNIASMATAAITSQPLEIVAKVTSQLPVVLEKAREKGIFERLNSRDSIAPKEDDNETNSKDKENEKVKQKELPKKETKEVPKEKETKEIKETNEIKEEKDHNKQQKSNTTIFIEDNIKLRPLQPPYNNPYVERVKQKIDDILKTPEVSTENILTASAKSREAKLKEEKEKPKEEVKESTDVKEEVPQMKETKEEVIKENDKIASEIRSEATKIVNSIITPVEQPKEPDNPPLNVVEEKKELKKEIEPIVTVVSEKKKTVTTEVVEKNETVIGEPEVEVQSSNVSTPAVEKMAVQAKGAEGSGSDKSMQSNGGVAPLLESGIKIGEFWKVSPPKGENLENQDENLEEAGSLQDEKASYSEDSILEITLEHYDEDEEEIKSDHSYPGQSTLQRFPQSTSTTPKPPARTKRDPKDKRPSDPESISEPKEQHGETKPQNICQRLVGKCKTCCSGGDQGEDTEGRQKGVMSRLNCCRKEDEREKDIERAAGKASVEFENEVKRKRKMRDILCGCCGRGRRVADMSPAQQVEPMSPVSGGETGCCGGRRPIERRDSILSDRPPTSCCNNRLCTWLRGMCRRSSEHSSSRRTSMFSKNKSLSPTMPPEDTRKKLDTSLVEHTSVMRGAIPVLPIALAYFCMMCNILVPGLGTIFSGMFCLCFGIPRFGVHDGAKHRIGSFVINLLVGCGQLFTVLFCLVGWGWSIWWGVIMVKIARKFRKLKAEAAAEEAEAPPVTANNHTRA